MGLKRVKISLHFYLKKQGSNDFLVISLYVDDIIYIGLSHSVVAEYKSSMMSRFEKLDLGLLHYFLGLKVK